MQLLNILMETKKYLRLKNTIKKVIDRKPDNIVGLKGEKGERGEKKRRSKKERERGRKAKEVKRGP